MLIRRGRPWPLGATANGKGVNFALFSAHANAVELCLYDTDGIRETERVMLKARTGDVWHAHVVGLKAGALYGYRVHGPYEPEQGHRFNHHKLLLDPYARAVHGDYVHADENHGYVIGSEELDLSFDTRDNAHNIPKCVVSAPTPTIQYRFDTPPCTPMQDTIIYEAHARGLTQRYPYLRSDRRGKYASLTSRRVIRYLQELGVTAIELLPVHYFLDEGHLGDKGLSNYWGYNSILFMTPAARYAQSQPVKEFRSMVKSMHSAGLEVILDVVYNHTAEGNELGPTLCYRGIDNRAYYRLLENRRYYINDSGCGNTINAAHPRVLQMITDSLRYWARDMMVDGFRFDLATVLGRSADGFSKDNGFFTALQQDPVLAGKKLIAEPWDIGPGGYQLGQYPQRWSEWNDQYRDTVRRYWNGEHGVLRSLSRVLHGCSDLFECGWRDSQASINFIASHDGFNLADLVSYNDRHNEANGEDNRDGHDHNLSINHGHEGDTDDPDILAARARHQRNLLATLMLSQGTPMLLAGDEFGHTQHGNNNAYCQDNETTWLDWSRRNNSALLTFVQRCIALRHRCPVLRRRHFLHGHYYSPSSGYQDIGWYNRHGELMQEHDWHDDGNLFLGMLLPGDAVQPVQPYNVTSAGLDDDQVGPGVLCLFNNHAEPVEFPLPEVPGPWTDELDTANDGLLPCEVQDSSVLCAPHSIRVLLLLP